MLAKTLSCGLSGVYGYPVEVEAFISNGMIGFEIVGLPSMAVKESRDRVRAAIAVSGLSFPFGKVTVNLAPADVKKEGTTFWNWPSRLLCWLRALRRRFMGWARPCCWASWRWTAVDARARCAGDGHHCCRAGRARTRFAQGERQGM